MRRTPWVGMMGSFAGLLALLTCTHTAHAFCGFYVDEGGKTLGNDATQVVLMRAGTKTVLSMQNDYKGPPDHFAMVVPVPVVLQKEQVKTLPRAILDKVEQLDAPRLVEYWEQDPCDQGGRGEGIGLGNIGTLGHGAGTGTGQGFGAGHVTVEAQFTVAEYEIVILSATDSSALDGWLKANKYHIPDGAEPLLRPYVTAGMKFFVAKVDPTKLKFQDGHAALSPLRFAYDTETFSLPVRLGLLNATGKQDLVVHILARQQRYEAANYANLTMPTNLDVEETTKGQFASFYATLFDHVSTEHPRTIVTEYSWDAASCDPCSGPALDANDIATLGGDVATGTGPLMARASGVSFSGGSLGEGIVERVMRTHGSSIAACAGAPMTVNLGFTIEADGRTSDVQTSGTTDAKVKSCFNERMTLVNFPSPTAKTRVALKLDVAPSGGSGAYGMTLTRLHLRYSKDDLRDDIVFKAADPVVGGREFMQARVDGGVELERGARPDTTNNFQSRYVIRHRWPGAVACPNPVRGIWGPRWATVDAASSGPQAATKLAFAKRDNVQYASFLTSEGNAELARALAAPGTAPPPPAPSASAAPAPSASAAPAAKGGGGCGSCAVGETDGASALPVLALAALALARLRRRERNPE